ncbi:hypothetical protein [Pseudonocardia sp. ICBG1034]|uniref:hypothetical protein n=1 Tax=Pseudonocardia sp. ICBG1034 TaxID=2844381 RepID=UPI001CCCF441|nr:hypothetical protein [Pseudonocardia sp. ICBG1034]
MISTLDHAEVLDPTSRVTASDPRTRPAGPDHPASRPPRRLVVGLRPDDNAPALLGPAARRARAERRPLLVAVARPAAPWTTDAVVHAVAADRLDSRLIALMRTACDVCADAGWPATTVLTVAAPGALTRRGRERQWQRRLRALAHSLDAELHPPHGGHSPPNVSPGPRPAATTRSS